MLHQLSYQQPHILNDASLWDLWNLYTSGRLRTGSKPSKPESVRHIHEILLDLFPHSFNIKKTINFLNNILKVLSFNLPPQLEKAQVYAKINHFHYIANRFLFRNLYAFLYTSCHSFNWSYSKWQN